MAQRIKEIGIRIAIGAGVQSIVIHFLKSATLYTMIGLLLGVIPAYFLLRFLGVYLNAIDAIDPWIFFGVTGSIFVCALVATFVPQRITRWKHFGWNRLNY